MTVAWTSMGALFDVVVGVGSLVLLFVLPAVLLSWLLYPMLDRLGRHRTAEQRIAFQHGLRRAYARIGKRLLLALGLWIAVVAIHRALRGA